MSNNSTNRSTVPYLNVAITYDSIWGEEHSTLQWSVTGRPSRGGDEEVKMLIEGQFRAQEIQNGLRGTEYGGAATSMQTAMSNVLNTTKYWSLLQPGVASVVAVKVATREGSIIQPLVGTPGGPQLARISTDHREYVFTPSGETADATSFAPWFC